MGGGGGGGGAAAAVAAGGKVGWTLNNMAWHNVPLFESHTAGVAFEFPDYHQVSDTWDKLDYDNMAVVTRAIALGLMQLASEAPAPKWHEDYAPARRYVEAGKKLHAQP